MYKINVENKVTGLKKEYQQPSKEAADKLIEKFTSRKLWGEPEDCTIIVKDLSEEVEFRNKQKIQARKKEYRSVEEVLHIILDHGIDSPEFAALQEERQLIKAKYAKE